MDGSDRRSTSSFARHGKKLPREITPRRWAQREGRTARNGTRGDRGGGRAVQERRRPTAAVAVVQSETSPVRLRLLVSFVSSVYACKL